MKTITGIIEKISVHPKGYFLTVNGLDYGGFGACPATEGDEISFEYDIAHKEDKTYLNIKKILYNKIVQHDLAEPMHKNQQTLIKTDWKDIYIARSVGLKAAVELAVAVQPITATADEIELLAARFSAWILAKQ